MTVMDKVQPYLVWNEETFDLGFHTDNISFEILELSHDEVMELIEDIKEQLELIWEEVNV